MREMIKRVIAAAAEAAGLPEGRVLEQSRADNLTIPRPRIELQWLPQSFSRTGRKLGHRAGGGPGKRLFKKEMYQTTLQVAANILAEDAAWLEAFTFSFIGSLPRGVNQAGNWVKITAERADWTEEPAPRVGLSPIKVFDRQAQLVVLSFTGRVTEEQEQQLIKDITFKTEPRK